MKAPAVHPLEQHEVAAGIRDRHRDRDSVRFGHCESRRHHLSRAREREASGRNHEYLVHVVLGAYLITPSSARQPRRAP